MEKKGKQDGKEYVLKMAREHNVKFVELWFTDILGHAQELCYSGIGAGKRN